MTTGLGDAVPIASEVGAGTALGTRTVRLVDAVGRVLAADVVAATALPVVDTSAMDGWAVAGAGPWRLDGAVRMGTAPGALAHGAARAITTGGAVPAGATAVLRSEHGRAEGGRLAVVDGVVVEHGADVRGAGQDVRPGAVVARRGAWVTPAVVAAVAAVGLDVLEVVATPRAAVVLVGDEVVGTGVPLAGQVRDALGVAVPEVLRDRGFDVVSVQRTPDDVGALCAAVETDAVDLVVTAGGTGHGASDHLAAALRGCAARTRFRGVAMRPGHPVLLAERPDGTPVLGLPGNPFAALVALTVVGLPLLAGMVGAVRPAARRRCAAERFTALPSCTRVVAVRDGPDGVTAVDHQGAATVCGAVDADGLALVTADVEPGGVVEVVDLPWRR